MQIGCQTIIFGRNIDNLDWVLANIANLGFTGVEFCQHPDRIRVFELETNQFRKATIEDIAIRLRRYGLAFLGMAGGSITERIAFCNRVDSVVRSKHQINQTDCTPLYYYSDDLDDPAMLQALQSGVKIGFHPHAFTKYERVEQAMSRFEFIDDPNLYWLPDTAHMAVAGEDAVAVLGMLPIEQIVAVHLKGYDRAYGRAYHRYARGFVSLNDDDPALLGSIQLLEARGFGGWLVIEQDFSHTDALASLNHSVMFLQKHGYSDVPQPRFETVDLGPVTQPVELAVELSSKVFAFTSAVYRAAEGRLEGCYQEIARSIRVLTAANHISLWSWNPAREDVCLLASFPPDLQTSAEPWRVNIDTSPLGRTRLPMDALEMEIAEFDSDATRFSYRRVAELTNSKYGFALAIPNRYNSHAVRMLVGGLTTNSVSSAYYREIIELIADDIGRAANAALDDACAVAAADVNLASDQNTETAPFLEAIAASVRRHIKCEAVSIFLVSREGDRLECRYDKQLRWRAGLTENDRCYRAAESQHPTVRCWQECKTILMASAVDEAFAGDNRQAKSNEVVSAAGESQDDILIVPLVAVTAQADGGAIATAIGVIRCRNKQQIECPIGTLHSPYFTDDDSAILSAMCQAAVPHIDTLLRDEGLTANLANLTHELNMPINTLQAAVDRVQTLIERGDYTRLQDLAEDMVSWTGLMRRIIDMADLFGKKAQMLEPECERIGLFGDVIAPLKPVMGKMLANRGFSVDHIEYAKFESLPLLYLDRNQFQMVFFNLFSNSIKYAYADPARFHVWIDAESQGGEFRIHFNDSGPGIAEENLKTIFDHGIRGPASLNKLVKGMGLGLWVVRRVVEAHEGHVEVTHLHDPTTITIFLPEARRSSPPAKIKKGK